MRYTSGGVKMSYLVLDIESIPLKITDESVWIYLSEKATVRTMHPVFSKVIAIGIKKPDSDPEVFHGENEKELLEKFWELMSELRPSSSSQIVTFNGYGYDVPFLLVRSAINNVNPTVSINMNKWNMERSNHFDCMLVLSAKGSFLNVAQEITCRMLGISVTGDTISGSEIEECYNKGDWKPIIERCKRDLIMTEELYKRLK
jgi:predicted PolB exonuclease-like 3'-5' exonuclease